MYKRQEYQTGRASIKDAAISAVKGFMAVGCFTLVPVELYKLSVTLQASLTSGITGYGESFDALDVYKRQALAVLFILWERRSSETTL